MAQSPLEPASINSPGVAAISTARSVSAPATILRRCAILTDAQFASVPVVDGAAGTDRLVFDNSAVTGFGRFTNWENVALTNATKFTLDGGGMTLGDAASRQPAR